MALSLYLKCQPILLFGVLSNIVGFFFRWISSSRDRYVLEGGTIASTLHIMFHLFRFVAKSDYIQIYENNLARIEFLAFLLNFHVIIVSEG